jgi:hypothetical protein
MLLAKIGAPFAKSSTPPRDPLFVDKQIGVDRYFVGQPPA